MDMDMHIAHEGVRIAQQSSGAVGSVDCSIGQEATRTTATRELNRGR